MKESLFIHKIIFYFVCFGLVFSQQAMSQQVAQLTQYRFHQLPFNPAYTGSIKGINIEMAMRGQWVGIKGLPFTQSIGVHAPSSTLKGGLGLVLLNDLIGAERHTSFYLSYAYRQKIGKHSILAIGIQAGAIQKSLDGRKLISPEGEYETNFIHNDNFIPLSIEGAVTPDIGIGIYAKSRKLELGLTTQHLLQPQFNILTTNGDINYIQKRHYLLQAAYNFSLGSVFDMSPSVLLQSDLNKHQLSGHILLTYDDFFQVGPTFRGASANSLDAIGIISSIQIGQTWKIGYAYDFPISALRKATTGSHELTIRYTLLNTIQAKKGKTIYNPRFL
ncbi:MAG: PorP/SprF family type IX secretion system membrane protein [Chitinophagales bacterium]